MEENAKQLELIKKLERITNMTIPTDQRGGVSDANTTCLLWSDYSRRFWYLLEMVTTTIP